MSSGFWDERFGGEEYAYGTEPNDFVRAEAHRIPQGEVLCIAEGEGRNAVHLAKLGHRVTAVDFSRAGLAKGRRLADAAGVEVQWLEADLTHSPLPRGPYCGVVSVFAHLPPPVRRRIHQEVAAVLEPGGWFLLEAYAPRQIERQTGGPRDPSLLMDLAEVSAELSPLVLEVAREVEREIWEGPYHCGPAIAIQIAGFRSGSLSFGSPVRLA